MRLKYFIYVFAICIVRHSCISADGEESTSARATTMSLLLPIPGLIKNLTSTGQDYRLLRIIEYIIPIESENVQADETQKQEPKDTILQPDVNLNQTTRATTTSEENNETSINTNFLMKVRKHDKVICVGNLISKNTVISSSNCFPNKPLTIDYKVEDIRKLQYDVKVIEFGTNFGSEVALLQLTRDILDLEPIPLCGINLSNHFNVTIYLTTRGINFLKTHIVDNAVCQNSYAREKSVFLTENMLCSQNSHVAQDCLLISVGDPLVYDNQLCGINIYEPQCVEDTINGALYANIFKSSSYIKVVMQNMD